MKPEAVDNSFSVSDLVAQFVLSREATPQDAGLQDVPDWHRDSLAGWHLTAHGDLPCRRIRIGGEIAGWILGHPIGPEGAPLCEALSLDPQSVDRSLSTFGGRFLVILPVLERVYLDACGLMSAVYCAERRVVASTPALIPLDEGTRERSELIEALGLPFRNAMFPVGMTPRRGIERILANHYLDLGSWQLVRHWPEAPLPPVHDVAAAVDEIADLCKRQLRGILSRGPAALRLTAGKDSRMILACAREVTGGLECVTAELGNDESRIDCAIARRLSRIAGLPHRVLAWAPPAPRDLELWRFRTGYAVGERRGWRGSTTYSRSLDRRRADILGVAGEIARGFWWLPEDSPASDIDAERLRSHTRCPSSPEVLARLDAWKSTAVAIDALQLLDLFYVEQRLGGWAGVIAYAEAGYAREQAFPLCHRRIVELMMRLPADYRRRGLLPDDVIAREWPELLALPFNQPTPSHRLLLGARAVGRRLKRLTSGSLPLLSRGRRW